MEVVFAFNRKRVQSRTDAGRLSHNLFSDTQRNS